MDTNKPSNTLSKHVMLAGITGLGLALSLTLAPSTLSAWAADGLLHNIRFDQGSRHFMIDTTGPVKAMVNTLTIAGRKRIIIDLDNADIGGDLPRDSQLLEDLTPQLPGLKNVTVNQYGGNGRPIVRVLLDLQGDPGAIRLIRNQGPHIELELSDYAASASTPVPSYNDTPPSKPSSFENPPSLSGLQGNYKPPKQPAVAKYNPDSHPTVTPPSYMPTSQSPPSSSGYQPNASFAPESTVSRELFNQGVRAQQDLKRQVDALQRQLDDQAANTSATGPQLDQMKRTLVNMNRQYDQLAQENQSLKSKIANSGQSNSSNQAELNRLQSQLNSLRSSNSELQTEVQTQTSRNSELQNRLTQSLSASTGPRVDEIKRQYEQLKLEKAQQSQQLEQLRQDKVQQGQQLQLSTMEKSSLTQQISQLKSQLASKSNSSASQPNVSSTELQELHRQLSLAQQSMTDSLRTIKEQNQEMAYLRNQVNSVKGGMDDAAKEQISSLQKQNEQKDAALIALRSQLSATLSASGANTSANNVATAQINSLKSQIESLNHQHQTELQNLNRQLADKEAQMEGLRQQVTLANAHQNEPAPNSVLKQRETRITELEQALYTANQKLTQQTSQGQSTLRDLATAKAKIAELQVDEQQIETYRHDLASAKQQIAQFHSNENELQTARQSVTQLKAELAQAKTEANTKANKSGQKEALAQLTHNNQQLTAQLQQVTAQLKTAQQEVATIKPSPDNSAQTAQLQQQVSSLEQSVSSLKSQAAQATQDANRAKEELRILQATKGKSTPAVATGNTGSNPALQKQIGDMNQQLVSLRRENDDLKNSLASKSSSAKAANPDAEAAFQEGKANLQAKKMVDALDKFKQALLLDPNNGRYTIDYSVALSEDQQYAEAIDVLRRYLQHNPLDREAYNQLGKIYLLNDQADAANQAFVRAIPVSTLNNYATSLKKLGHMEDAENVFKMALSINPKDSEVLFNLGNLYNNQNKLDLARNKYLEAIQIRPDFAEAHYNLGLIFSKLGDNPKAVVHLEKFLQLSPNARNAETIRAYVQKLKA